MISLDYKPAAIQSLFTFGIDKVCTNFLKISETLFVHRYIFITAISYQSSYNFVALE